MGKNKSRGKGWRLRTLLAELFTQFHAYHIRPGTVQSRAETEIHDTQRRIIFDLPRPRTFIVIWIYMALGLLAFRSIAYRSQKGEHGWDNMYIRRWGIWVYFFRVLLEYERIYTAELPHSSGSCAWTPVAARVIIVWYSVGIDLECWWVGCSVSAATVLAISNMENWNNHVCHWNMMTPKAHHVQGLLALSIRKECFNVVVGEDRCCQIGAGHVIQRGKS